jgi:hypothetical protein
VPRVTLVRGDAITQAHFEAILPPHTALYVSDRHFLQVLGFAAGSVTTVELEPSLAVYGFVNKEATFLKVTGGAVLQRQLLAVQHVDLRGNEPAPPNNSVAMQVAFFTDWLPLRLAKKRPLNRVGCTEALSLLVEEGLKRLNLDTSALQVKDSSLREIAFESKAFGPEVKVDLEVKFSTEVSNYLSMMEPLLVFPLNDSRTLLFEAKDDYEDDPLEPHYPVHLLTPGQGRSNCFVQGMGIVSSLGLMINPEQFHGGGLELSGDIQELRVRLLDKTRSPLRAKEKTSFTLNLEMNLF